MVENEEILDWAGKRLPALFVAATATMIASVAAIGVMATMWAMWS